MKEKMKANKIIRRLAYRLFTNWYRKQMQNALDRSNARRAERMDAWIEQQCYKHYRYWAVADSL